MNSKDPHTYFYHLAMDVAGSLTDDDHYLDSIVRADDIMAYRGVVALDLAGHSERVLVIYVRDTECNDIDLGDVPPIELAQLRQELAKLGLIELACYCLPPDSEENQDGEDAECEFVRYYTYSLVVQIPTSAEPDKNPLSFENAARKVAALIWTVAP